MDSLERRLQRRRGMRRCIGLWFLSGCLSSMVPDPPARNDAQLTALLGAGSFRGDGFRKIDRAPFASTVHTGDSIDVYVSQAAAADYELVEPDRDGEAPPISAGTVIVREILGQKLTVMEKREAGSFSGGGDFLYAVTDFAGNPLAADDGSAQWGSLAMCASCHATREQSSWLFGVLPADR
jgi:hypothetical protein